MCSCWNKCIIIIEIIIKKLIIAPPPTHGLTLTSFFSLSFSVGILMVSLSKVPANHSGLCLLMITLSEASDSVFMLSCFSRPVVFFPWLCVLVLTLEHVGSDLGLSGCWRLGEAVLPCVLPVSAKGSFPCPLEAVSSFSEPSGSLFLLLSWPWGSYSGFELLASGRGSVAMSWCAECGVYCECGERPSV